MTKSQDLNQRIIACTKCPRLIKYCKNIAQEKRKAYQEWTYWGKPVQNFGRLPSKILIVGLAPAAHGANRTGRLFTGDNSGLWLYRAMHRSGFANQEEESTSIDDGLELIDASITCVGHCAPPDNKLTPKEIENCSGFFQESLNTSKAQVIIALGRVAWDAVLKDFRKRDPLLKKPLFKHGQVFEFQGLHLIASFHPSQQNTFTKRLTEDMFDEIFSKAKSYLS